MNQSGVNESGVNEISPEAKIITDLHKLNKLATSDIVDISDEIIPLVAKLVKSGEIHIPEELNLER